MRILVAIVHHWNPEGGGRHVSLRADAAPRVAALRDSILAFSRLAGHQKYFHFSDQAAYPANLDQQLELDISVITDGQNHILDKLDPPMLGRLKHVKTNPEHPLKLGFEAHQFLASHLQDSYDLYVYAEDDLVIHDPWFFHKIKVFTEMFGQDCVLLPQRYELRPIPTRFNKIYIDGVMPASELLKWTPEPPEAKRFLDPLIGALNFESPLNPHAGCFVLTKQQLGHWVEQPWWLDRDCSFITPLESAATLGLLKTFQLYKPSFAQAKWLELQHWGTGFFSLIGQSSRQRSDTALNG